MDFWLCNELFGFQVGLYLLYLLIQTCINMKFISRFWIALLQGELVWFESCLGEDTSVFDLFGELNVIWWVHWMSCSDLLQCYFQFVADLYQWNINQSLRYIVAIFKLDGYFCWCVAIDHAILYILACILAGVRGWAGPQVGVREWQPLKSGGLGAATFGKKFPPTFLRHHWKIEKSMKKEKNPTL